MKVLDGFEEISIISWRECKECKNDLHFANRAAALSYLQRIAKSTAVLDSLRRFVRDSGRDATPRFCSNARALDQVAQMIATRELHVTTTRQSFKKGIADLFQGAAVSVGKESASTPAARTPSQPAAPPPEEPVLASNADMAAIADVLTQAALSGVPFCAECARRAAARGAAS